MKKYIIGCVMVVFIAIIFNFFVMPFVSAYFQVDVMALVNNQLTNDVAYSSSAIATGLLPDTIIMMVVNFVLVMFLGFFLYKTYEEYVLEYGN